jgi:acylphosphatase
MQKCYNVAIIGKVQDIALRNLIEDIAGTLDLKGFAFNDTDGSLKMVCCGDTKVINNFLKEIRLRGEQKGAVIEDIKKEQIPFHIYLPQKFIRLYTDELKDISRKLDIGVELLKDIKSDTSALPRIETILISLVSGQEEHNKEQREHNQRLERILEKLAEK